jgi:hypothetical protein
MDKYRLVEEHKADVTEDFLQSSAGSFPEVRITQQGKPRNYISYAMNLFVSSDFQVVLDCSVDSDPFTAGIYCSRMVHKRLYSKQWDVQLTRQSRLLRF